jgi:hypothetical protein
VSTVLINLERGLSFFLKETKSRRRKRTRDPLKLMYTQRLKNQRKDKNRRVHTNVRTPYTHDKQLCLAVHIDGNK